MLTHHNYHLYSEKQLKDIEILFQIHPSLISINFMCVLDSTREAGALQGRQVHTLGIRYLSANFPSDLLNQ